jgi:DNA-binding MarR family transcriptional regulator
MTTRQPPPVTVAQLLHRAATRLRREIEHQVLDRVDISWSAYEVLHTLLRGAARTPKAVSAVIDVPAPTLTAIIKRLADTGLIVRVPDVHDRRVIHLRLTKYGRSLTVRLAAEVEILQATLLSAVTTQDLTAAEPALRALQQTEPDR